MDSAQPFVMSKWLRHSSTDWSKFLFFLSLANRGKALANEAEIKENLVGVFWMRIENEGKRRTWRIFSQMWCLRAYKEDEWKKSSPWSTLVMNRFHHIKYFRYKKIILNIQSPWTYISSRWSFPFILYNSPCCSYHFLKKNLCRNYTIKCILVDETSYNNYENIQEVHDEPSVVIVQ